MTTDASELRAMTVEEAIENGVCRICGGPDRPIQVTPVAIDSFVLNYGMEYAHASCLGQPLTQVWAGFPSLVIDDVSESGEIRLKPPVGTEEN